MKAILKTTFNSIILIPSLSIDTKWTENTSKTIKNLFSIEKIVDITYEAVIYSMVYNQCHKKYVS